MTSRKLAKQVAKKVLPVNREPIFAPINADFFQKYLTSIKPVAVSVNDRKLFATEDLRELLEKQQAEIPTTKYINVQQFDGKSSIRKYFIAHENKPKQSVASIEYTVKKNDIENVKIDIKDTSFSGTIITPNLAGSSAPALIFAFKNGKLDKSSLGDKVKSGVSSIEFAQNTQDGNIFVLSNNVFGTKMKPLISPKKSWELISEQNLVTDQSSIDSVSYYTAHIQAPKVDMTRSEPSYSLVSLLESAAQSKSNIASSAPELYSVPSSAVSEYIINPALEVTRDAKYKSIIRAKSESYDSDISWQRGKASTHEVALRSESQSWKGKIFSDEEIDKILQDKKMTLPSKDSLARKVFETIEDIEGMMYVLGKITGASSVESSTDQLD